MSRLTIPYPQQLSRNFPRTKLPTILKLADLTVNTPSCIDFLPGTEQYATIMLDATINENSNTTFPDSLFTFSFVLGRALSMSCYFVASVSPQQNRYQKKTLKIFWKTFKHYRNRHFTKERQTCKNPSNEVQHVIS